MDQVQSNIAQVLTPISKVLFLDGVLLTDVNLAPGSNRIDHKLNRKPQGWWFTDQTDEIPVFREDWTSLTITLNNTDLSNDTVRSIWVF